MKIVHIVPGSGNTFYCQNCLRDGSLVQNLRVQGHDVVIVPMYLPLFTDRPGVTGSSPVFYGAINVYLKESSALFRLLPRWMGRILDTRWLLEYAARKAGSTQARGLEAMTISMLRGEEGHQAVELERLVEWLSVEGRPDVVHLSNAMLIGLARRIRQRLGCPVVCTMQDEDSWINSMEKDSAARIWQTMSERAQDVDAFVAVSSYYRDRMKELARIPDRKLHIVHIGIDPAEYGLSTTPLDPPVIGFLSRLCPALGLDILVDAFIQLKNEPRLSGAKLSLSGGAVGRDQAFVRQIRRTLARHHMEDDLLVSPEFAHDTRLRFLQSLTVLSVPVPQGEAFGIYLLEAQASGVPVVQPDAGAFPEIIKKAGGGILYSPNNAASLAAALKSLLLDPTRLKELARKGRNGVAQHFTLERMAARMLQVYRGVSTAR